VREQQQRRQIRSQFVHTFARAGRAACALAGTARARRRGARDDHHVLGHGAASTAISETYKNDPQGLTALMNRFLTPLSTRSSPARATIDKYMATPSWRSVSAARRTQQPAQTPAKPRLDMLERVDELTASVSRSGRRGHVYVPLNIGVAQHRRLRGRNMGSDVRFDYRCSATASIGSRLEGSSKDNTASRSSWVRKLRWR